jgi:membrane protease subunit (stomatin/prohibitin family)
MALLEKIRAEFVDIVEWVDDDRKTLTWRFPRYHNQIKQGAQLIVRPGQVAVFVHRGKIADVFQPGTHRLETGNLPGLSTLQGWPFGFDSPFKAEVYFVATRQVTELKWGTPQPVLVRDPDFGPLRVRAFGTYTLRTLDPCALLRELVGTSETFEAAEIGVLLRGIIANAFAELVATSGISVVDLAARYGELSERLRTMVAERIDDEYGLAVPQLYIVNVSVPEEVSAALDARASLGMVGDVDLYRQYQLGRSTPVAAANPAGGLAGAGVGVGMGLAYAGAAVPSASVVPARVWHVAVGGHTHGPLDANQLRAAIARGEVTAQSPVWTPGMSGWMPASQVAELAGLFPPPPPPPPA